MIEGELRFLAGGKELRASAGESILAPHGVPHTCRAVSPSGARSLTIMRGGNFEGLVREFGRPAGREELPDALGSPTPEQAGALDQA